jgi:hypothetical protein
MFNMPLVSRKCPTSRVIDFAVLVALLFSIGCTLILAGQQFRTLSATATPAVHSSAN